MLKRVRLRSFNICKQIIVAITFAISRRFWNVSSSVFHTFKMYFGSVGSIEFSDKRSSWSVKYRVRLQLTSFSAFLKVSRISSRRVENR